MQQQLIDDAVKLKQDAEKLADRTRTLMSQSELKGTETPIRMLLRHAQGIAAAIDKIFGSNVSVERRA